VVETKLYTPQPNPFRAHLAIHYSLAAEGPVTLRVHDLAGHVVRTLAGGVGRSGRYAVSWNGTDDRGRELARGVYSVKLTAGTYQATRKTVVE